MVKWRRCYFLRLLRCHIEFYESRRIVIEKTSHNLVFSTFWLHTKIKDRKYIPLAKPRFIERISLISTFFGRIPYYKISVAKKIKSFSTELST